MNSFKSNCSIPTVMPQRRHGGTCSSHIESAVTCLSGSRACREARTLLGLSHLVATLPKMGECASDTSPKAPSPMGPKMFRSSCAAHARRSQH